MYVWLRCDCQPTGPKCILRSPKIHSLDGGWDQHQPGNLRAGRSRISEVVSTQPKATTNPSTNPKTKIDQQAGGVLGLVVPEVSGADCISRELL